ncbi:MAG: hypothetical protein KUA35_15850 [Pseudodesulfovibrio sp.]|uniref:DUF6680 family protein n=1 Tax=Pseudodesulfovibrio TaxID=2035811 RepID=UPI00059DF5C9|nr:MULTISPECIES: DUF6680 family protein [Pseudodesulfovibrio]MBU4191476.1 hypothetical protein [Pseudomonadota bacterium]MBU4244904.1 hypothetical protein [Pseudomonadota bacterium]MBU4379692.1 hypothetical protein [Pseudomonadota bacterium]MBU4475672.1 hypothetical protein [Pseudomonadota bacterium]MBU4515496.1 hypothetical protein [Pseudomonadota bacterium]
MEWVEKHLFELLTLVAIFMGPVMAVLVGQHLQDRRQRSDRRQQVYKDLMGTRRIVLHIDHVKALNMIDVEFSSASKEDVAIRDAWQLYIRHLEDVQFRDNDLNGWGRKTDELLHSLLEKMSLAVGVSVQRHQIAKGGYSPEFYGNVEFEQQILRRSLIDLALGRKTLKVYHTDEDPIRVDAPVPEVGVK